MKNLHFPEKKFFKYDEILFVTLVWLMYLLYYSIPDGPVFKLF